MTDNTTPTNSVFEALVATLEESSLYWHNGSHTVFSPTRGAYEIMARFEVRSPADNVRDALAKAWDEGVRVAGAYGHEDTWTHDMTPYTQNPYREARS